MKRAPAVVWVWGTALLIGAADAEEMARPHGPGSGARGIPATDAGEIARLHGLGIHADVKYDADFEHFDYVDPDAPKGGELRLAAIGSFDNLNPFILKGVAARGTTLIYSRLCTKSLDEPLSEYGQLAEAIECPPDRSWVTFHLRPEARWHDGKPLTAADVVFTFETLLAKGTPFYRSFYADVDTVEQRDNQTVTFRFKPGVNNRELPLILGQLRILPQHYWQQRDFAATTLDPPLGSGPYRIATVDPGRSLTYERVEGNWDQDLPVMRGQYNFDTIRYEYYRDETVAVEAFKAGEYDLRFAGSASEWATAYDIEAVAEGRLVREMIPHEIIRGMSGFVFNTRRAKFADPKVRRALGFAFDFEWTNAALFHGLYTRTASYFDNSELAARDLPAGTELAILDEFRDRLPRELFVDPYGPPASDNEGGIRANLRTARALLAESGWHLTNGKLVQGESGEQMEIEFLLVRPTYERVIAPMQKQLMRLDIESRLRTVDASQYWNRLKEFDYDLVVRSWSQYLSPGNEQRNYWTSAAAAAPGSRNYPGIRDPVVDALVERLIAAPDRATQVATARALDRVLLWGHYVIPHWHSRYHRVIYWDKFGRPDILPANDLALLRTWWVDGEKAARRRGGK